MSPSLRLIEVLVEQPQEETMANPMAESFGALGICLKDCEASGMQTSHDPKVSQRDDGSWTVNCSECLRSPDG